MMHAILHILLRLFASAAESLGAPTPVISSSYAEEPAPLAAPGAEASADQHFRIPNIRIELEEERVRRKELEKSMASLERE